jgi:hypothetical protein
MSNINITAHIKKRWVERVNPTAGDNADQEVLKAFENSDYIWDDPEGMSFYVNSDHWIFCADLQKRNSLVTIFEADYGFPPDINRQVANGLLQKIRKARVNIEKVRNQQLAQRSKIEDERHQIQHQMEMLQLQFNRLDNTEKEMDLEMKKKQKELDNLAYQLTYSINFRAEKLANFK